VEGRESENEKVKKKLWGKGGKKPEQGKRKKEKKGYGVG
jgi:hypothetical protein